MVYNRSTLFLDIEAIPADPNGPDDDALHHTKSRIVYMAAAYNDYPVTGFDNPAGDRPGEDQLMWSLWGFICAAGWANQPPLLVGYNLHGFDLPRIWLRAKRIRCPLAEWLPHPSLPAWKTPNVIDPTTLFLQTGPRVPRPHLDDLAAFLDIGRPENPGSGSMVRTWWRAGETQKIADHCQSDVDTIRTVYERLYLASPMAPQ